jgi:hypothetical protein
MNPTKGDTYKIYYSDQQTGAAGGPVAILTLATSGILINGQCHLLPPNQVIKRMGNQRWSSLLTGDDSTTQKLGIP